MILQHANLFFIDILYFILFIYDLCYSYDTFCVSLYYFIHPPLYLPYCSYLMCFVNLNYNLLFQEWVDERLTWTVNASYPFNQLSIRSDKVWLPDLSVYNRYMAGSVATAFLQGIRFERLLPTRSLFPIYDLSLYSQTYLSLFHTVTNFR